MKTSFVGDRVGSPLDGEHLDIILADFSHHLQSLGYASLTVQDYCRSAKHFFRWLRARHVQPADITREIIRSFLQKHLRHCHCPRPASRDSRTSGTALWRLLERLQMQGIIRQKKVGAGTPRERIITQFDRFLLDVRGLAPTTRQARRRTALELLAWRFGNRPLRLHAITAKDLVRFVSQPSHRN